MAALIPAIIDFVMSRRRRGGGGGGGGGGRPEKSTEEKMREYMAMSFIKELDNVQGAVNAYAPEGGRSLIPQIKAGMGGVQYPAVTPGVFQNPVKQE